MAPDKWERRDPNYSWVINHSSFDKYQDEFGETEAGKLLISNLYTLLREHPSPVILDLLSEPDAIYSLDKKIPNKISGLSIGLNNTKPIGFSNHKESNSIKHLNSDLNHRHTFQLISQWLGDKKANLIIERGFGAITEIKQTPRNYWRIFSHLWNFSEPNGGMIILQTPSFKELRENNIPIYEWISNLESQGHLCLSIPHYSKTLHYPNHVPGPKIDTFDFGQIIIQRNH